VVDAEMMIPVNCRAQNFFARVGTAPGGIGGTPYTRTLGLYVNGVFSPVYCVISRFNTQCTSGSTLALSAGDLVTIISERSGNPSPSDATIGFECR
jgi:hypothetical protein